MTLTEFVLLLRSRVTAAGLENPYIVAEDINNSYNNSATYLAAGFDALTDYQGGYGGSVALQDQGPTYAGATVGLLQTYNTKFWGGMNFIPPMPIGMYQWPRASAKSYYHYCNPLPGDIKARIKQIFDFVRSNPKKCDAQVVFSYSWNEHSEGGAICPTMGKTPDYIPVTTCLDEVAEALK